MKLCERSTANIQVLNSSGSSKNKTLSGHSFPRQMRWRASLTPRRCWVHSCSFWCVGSALLAPRGLLWPLTLADPCIYCPRDRFRGKNRSWPLWKLFWFLRPIKLLNCTVPNLRACRLCSFLVVQLLPVALSARERWSHLKEFQSG